MERAYFDENPEAERQHLHRQHQQDGMSSRMPLWPSPLVEMELRKYLGDD